MYTGVPEPIIHDRMTQKTAHPLPPPIAKKIFTPIHPVVAEKDKSIHSTHGVIHYPWWFGSLASCVSVLATQPLGVAGVRTPPIGNTGHH